MPEMLHHLESMWRIVWVHVERNFSLQPSPVPPMTVLCDQGGVRPMPEMIAPLHLRFSFQFNIVMAGAGWGMRAEWREAVVVTRVLVYGEVRNGEALLTRGT